MAHAGLYAWDIDEAQLLLKKDLASTVQQLAQKCPPEQQEALARLTLLSIAMAAQEKATTLDKAEALGQVHKILADAPLARQNGDIFINYSNDIVAVLTTAGTAERTTLLGPEQRAGQIIGRGRFIQSRPIGRCASQGFVGSDG